MNRRFVILLVMAAVVLSSCRRAVQVCSFSSEAIAIDGSKDAVQDSGYILSLAPVKASLEQEMGVVLGYAPDRMWVRQPECPMLNWASDALLDAARKHYGGRVDFSVVNIGGMRCEWPSGAITRRSVFELMPFDNRLVVLTLSGEDVAALCESFVRYGGQGVSGLRLKAVDGRLAEVTIGGKALDLQSQYKVATSDYLSGGADHMEALSRYTEYWDSDLLIRDLYIQEVELQHTVTAPVDGRMTLL